MIDIKQYIRDSIGNYLSLIKSSINGKEESLGNPDSDGKVLSSLSDGTRSWISSSNASSFVRNSTILEDPLNATSTIESSGFASTVWFDVYSDGTGVAIDNAKNIYSVDLSTGVFTQGGTFADYHPRGMVVGYNDVGYYSTGSYLKTLLTGAQEFDLTGKQVSNIITMSISEDRKHIILFDSSTSNIADYVSIETMSYSHTVSIHSSLKKGDISPLFLDGKVYSIDKGNDTILMWSELDLAAEPTVIQTDVDFNASSTYDTSFGLDTNGDVLIYSYTYVDGAGAYRFHSFDTTVISEDIPYGDMSKSTYDSNDNGKVDNAENADTVNNLTVETAVPSGALFTDTVYSHPSGSGYNHLPIGGTVGQVLTNTEDGNGTWQDLPAGSGEPTTFEALNANGDIGIDSDQVASGDHSHGGIYEPADSTILKDADIGVNIQGYDANIVSDPSYSSVVKYNVSNTFSAIQKGLVATEDDLSINLSVSNNYKATGDGTLIMTGGFDGQSGNIIITTSNGITGISGASVDDNFLTTVGSAGTYWISYMVSGGSYLFSNIW